MKRIQTLCLALVFVLGFGLFAGGALADADGWSAGNTSNGGMVTAIGSDVYFADPAEGGAICRLSANGTKTRLNNAHSQYLYAYGGYLYYRNQSDKGRLYRMKADGSEDVCIAACSAQNIQVLDDRIYFINGSQGKRAYVCDLDGRNARALCPRACRKLQVYDGDVYVVGRKQSSKPEDPCYVYRISPGDKNYERLTVESSYYLNVADGWIYYQNLERFDRTFRMRLDGSDKTRLSDMGANYLNVSGGYVYCAGTVDKCVYRIPVDGGTPELLCSMPAANLNIALDRLFFVSGGQMYALALAGGDPVCVS